MAKIVIDARESGTSTGRYVDKLLEHLHDLQPDHQIITLTREARVQYLQNLTPNFTVLETAYKEFTFGEQIGLKRQIERLHPDLVHFTMVQQPVLYRGRVVTTMHDLTTARFRNPAKNPIVFWTKQQVYKWVNRYVARTSKAILTPSEFVRKDVAGFTHTNPTKITVTMEAADLISDAPEPILNLEDSQFIMYIGRPTPHKNLERLIDAYAELKKTHPKLKLVLAGKKDTLYEAHERRAQAKGIDGIVFTGYISDGQLRWLYEHTAAYAFPSLSEGFGLPGVEAMMHGAPVVASNATCLPEVLGDAAHYFDPLSVADMQAKISEVIDNQELREQLIAKGRDRAALYSWNKMATQTLQIYEAALTQ